MRLEGTGRGGGQAGQLYQWGASWLKTWETAGSRLDSARKVAGGVGLLKLGTE
jgi:hypothetical protein